MKKSSKDSVRFKIPNKEKEDSVATITTYKSQDGVKPEEPKKSQKLEEWIKTLLLKPISACVPTPKHKENKGEKVKKKSQEKIKPDEDVPIKQTEEEKPQDKEEKQLQKEESVPNKLDEENKPPQNELDVQSNKLEEENEPKNKLEEENKPSQSEGNEPKKLEELDVQSNKLEEENKPPQSEGNEPKKLEELDVQPKKLEELDVQPKKSEELDVQPKKSEELDVQSNKLDEENKPPQSEGNEPKKLEELDVQPNKLDEENVPKSKLEEENKPPQTEENEPKKLEELDVQPKKLEELDVQPKKSKELDVQPKKSEELDVQPKKLEEEKVPVLEGKLKENEASNKDMQKQESKDERESHYLSKFSDPFILNIVVEEPVREVSAKNFASKNVGTSFDKIELANKKIGTSFDKIIPKKDQNGNNGIKPIKLAPFREKNVNMRHGRHFDRVIKRRDFIERYYELDSKNDVPILNLPVYGSQDVGEDGLKYKSLRETIKFAIPLMYNIIKNLDSTEGTNTDPKCGAKNITSDEIFTYLETKTDTFNKVADPLGYLETEDQKKNEAGASKVVKK